MAACGHSSLSYIEEWTVGCRGSEEDTEAESGIALSVDVAGQGFRAVGGIAVEAGNVEAPVLLRIGINLETDFG